MSQEDFYKKLSRRVSVALAASAILNISLLAFGLYEWQEGGFSYLATSPFKPQKAKLYRQNGKDLATLTQSLRELEALDFDQLVTHLGDSNFVAEGYKKQDIALSLLVMLHYFDLEKAIGGHPSARRLFKYMSQDNGPAEIILYPSLTNDQLDLCIDFAKNERWPYTSEGMHARLNAEQDLSLKDAFMQTDEFRVVELLLRRGTQITKEQVVDLVLKSDWKEVKNLFDEMRKAQDFSPEVRRSFLLKTLPKSADILVQSDTRFALHSLKDPEVVVVLANLRPELAKEYALGLLESPRSNVVWQKAIGVLSAGLGLDPTKETRQSLLQRFGRIQAPKVPKVVAQVAPPAKAALKPAPQTTKAIREILYTVQPGDNLWLISKRFGIDIQVIKKHNKLTSDALKPGSTLRIPQQKPSK